MKSMIFKRIGKVWQNPIHLRFRVGRGSENSIPAKKLTQLCNNSLSGGFPLLIMFYFNFLGLSKLKILLDKYIFYAMFNARTQKI